MALPPDRSSRTVPVRGQPLPRAAVLLAGLVVGSLCGADTRGLLPVSATVMPYARLTAVVAPTSFAVSAEDVARGYVDIVEPTTFAVAHNTRGYVLEVYALLPIAAEIDVYGLPQQVRLAGTGGSIEHHTTGTSGEQVALTYRVVLGPDARTGTYPWPLQLAVRPL